MNTLLLPDNESTETPELSIVIPALNEEITISEFVAWCQKGIQDAGIASEILIIDSSTDRTAELALAGGARVLKAPKQGLGRAYQAALPHVRGKFILMGDADCTYDFRQIKPFVESFRQGNEFIMGSRFRGFVEPGSMPLLHRYFGTPVTTEILNVIYRSKFTDIHCGMRGITREAFVQMRLRSSSWEYASEMVLKSVQMKLKTTEVPVRFLKDKEGRFSHHKRQGWLSPWKAGWINLRAMLVNGVDFFALRPGFWLFCFGMTLSYSLTFGSIRVGPITFSIFWMLLGMSLTVVGLQSFYMGCLGRVLHDYKGTSRRFWLEFFSYNRSMLASGLIFTIGFLLLLPLCRVYWQHHFILPLEIGPVHHMAVAGLLSMILAFMNFIFTLILHAVAISLGDNEPQSSDVNNAIAHHDQKGTTV